MSLGETDLAPETVALLWAARETGALAALTDDADSAADVAAAADLDPDGAALLVESLVETGFLARVGGGVEPTNRLLGFLAAADLRSVGALPDALDAFDALAALPETLASGEPPADTDPTRRLGARAAADEARVRAVATAAVRAAPDADTVLVVDDAPGPHAEAVAALGYDVVLADEPEAIERSRPLLATSDVRGEAVAADDPLPAADLALAPDATRRREPAENEALLTRLRDAVAPDGTVALADVVWGESDDPVPAAVTAFARDGGRAYRVGEYAAWAEAAGLAEPRTRDVPGTDRTLLVTEPA